MLTTQTRIIQLLSTRTRIFKLDFLLLYFSKCLEFNYYASKCKIDRTGKIHRRSISSPKYFTLYENASFLTNRVYLTLYRALEYLRCSNSIGASKRLLLPSIKRGLGSKLLNHRFSEEWKSKVSGLLRAIQ